LAEHSVGGIILQHVRDSRKSYLLTFLNGMEHLLKAQKEADAQQESRILMLSDKARAMQIPILLID